MSENSHKVRPGLYVRLCVGLCSGLCAGLICLAAYAGNSGHSQPGNKTTYTYPSPGPDFFINAGLNDAWFDEQTPGQGFFITVYPQIGKILLAWFTFDTVRPDPDIVANLGAAGHRWITALGTYAEKIASLEIELTRGGVFAAAEPGVQQSAYGTITIEFIDCNNAMLLYDIPSAGLTGEIPITRIALDNVLACRAGQPQ